MLFAAALLALSAAPELAPGVRYDPAIPTVQGVLGYAPGERITAPDEAARYLEALAAAAPERTRLIRYAQSFEERPLQVLLLGSPARLAALADVQQGLKRLADPRGLGQAEAERLLHELPVAVWLMHAVHGNEVSSTDAALYEAYHLLAARDDPAAAAILQETIVLIDPLQNPDGRARFVAGHEQAAGAEPDPDPLAAEHDEPWPSGRGNHYLFDMNRDWIALSQPETRGRVSLYLDWMPQVVVDLHEMGGESTYYFAPPADPLNPAITPRQREWLARFGRANAARFDERGFAYFVRDQFDSFYPGYGESWPILQGAVGMTFEQASPRGLLYRRQDGSLLRYRDAVAHHFTAALATLETAAANREALLRDFLEYRRSALAEGARGLREYLLPPGGDESRRLHLVELLVQQGLEVFQTEEAARLSGRTLPVGTFVVPLAQPGGRLLRNLLDLEVPLDEAFVREQDRRRQKRLDDEFYDVTAWSLPLALDVEVVATERPLGVRQARWRPPAAAGASSLPPARVGYLLPWNLTTAAAVVDALGVGLKVRSMGKAFAIGGRTWPAGTIFVPRADNPPDLPMLLGTMLLDHPVVVVPVQSGFVESGLSFGGGEVAALRPVRVLLGWDEPTESTSAGWARFVLERRLGLSATALRLESFARVDLRRFDVVVLPSGDYGDALGEGDRRRLKEWIRSGGTLITLADASRWAGGEKVKLLATRAELRGGRPETDEDEDEDDKPAPDPPAGDFDLEKAVQPVRERPESTPGALLRVLLDQDHWLSAGLDGEVQAFVEGRRVFTPLRLDRGTNVGLYAPEDRLVASGLVWEEARAQLAQKAFLMHQPIGQGHLVAFAEDPNFRALAEATELLFANAVLLAPAQ